MKGLVIAGIAQGISMPLLMIVVMRITSDREVMGTCTSTSRMNALG
jgi:Mn2+/Fe2+ NRAMP family transporter